ncbi:acyl-CoA reductase [Lachnospiraceae bacterium 62-35]
MKNNFSGQTVLNSITYLVGNADILGNMSSIPAKKPFDDGIIEFMNDVSRTLMGMREAKMYSDIVTLAFWIRKASVMRLKERFYEQDRYICLGRGMVFHIAPSNVPVNYAYSLFTGLLTGNANIVRIPSKDFPQVEIINRAINEALKNHEEIRPYICLARYDRSREINDLLSLTADMRIIWGGDATIGEIRKSPLKPRAGEITFANRYSLAVIDSDRYLAIEDKGKIAEDFYNDTYLTDQNACTSPRIVVWKGNKKEEAKKEFWNNLHEVVKKKYGFQPIQAVNKLVSSYLLGAVQDGVKIECCEDNLIVRVKVSEIREDIMDFMDNSGYFFEYDCENILELRKLCDDRQCQTVAYIGEGEMLMPLIHSGVRGIDRIVPVGKTMDFDLIWDGYNLFERLTRIVKID